MKKHLYVIGGTMGAGKTTVCNILKKKLKKQCFPGRGLVLGYGAFLGDRRDQGNGNG